ncbi:MAG: metal-sulfur cluster assembly factor [Chloroflexi bacterium]|nr:metal-sulfur cluster assembly factor [Chloroflexota bacterium]
MTVSITEDLVLDALRTVIDPELGINIVDLGLVYDIHVEGENIDILMTMTTPACPLGAHITAEATYAIEQATGSRDVAIDLVWSPAWTPMMMSLAAKQQLGWLS